MTIHFRTLTAIAILVLPTLAASPAWSGGGDESRTASSSEIAAALRTAGRSGDVRFNLLVHRTDRDGQRSLEAFPSGIAIWNGRSQIELSREVRASLLAILHDRDFASMAPSYGGRREPARGTEGAALRVTCRVELEIDGLRKTSVQLADGEQSKLLASLADALLDRAEPLSDHGVPAANLSDGLRKLAQGTLAAETLRLRFVRLPSREQDGEGAILMIRDGTVSSKAYTPGRRIGEEVVSDLTDARLTAMVGALNEADVESLPVNLWAADHVELDVQVLGHRTTVVGRDFQGRSSDEQKDARQRFDRLVLFLSDFEAAPAPVTP